MDNRDIILKECLEEVRKKHYNGILLLPTGSGKGRIMIEIAKTLKPKTILYLCDNTDLRDNMFKKELIKWGAEDFINITTFSCYQSAYKWNDCYYDLVLCDEFDAALTQEYSRVFEIVKYTNRICVSATLDSEKRKFAENIDSVVYEKTLQEFIDRGILNKVDYYVVNYDLTPKENIQYLGYNKQFHYILNDTSGSEKVKSKLNYLKISRKQFLSSTTNGAKAARWIADSVKEKDGNVLIFCGLSKQADKISPYSYHSNSTNNKEILTSFNNGEIKEMAVVEKITRGVNLSNVKYIIHETVGTSKTKLIQKTGRGMRLESWDTLKVFFLCPYYRHPFKGRVPTVVGKWIDDITSDLNMSNVKYVNFKTE